MDIHAPDKPILTLKEFAVHIAVVTVGILIALGLEGIREVFHDRHLARETRENFRAELGYDLAHGELESSAVSAADQQIKQLVVDLPALAKDHPEQIVQRLDQVHNPGYFITETSWQTALSTGSLAHMSTEQVLTYAGAFENIRVYTTYQAQEVTAQDRATLFFAAHPHPTPAELEEGTERLLLFERAESYLVQLGEQLRANLRNALKL